jgi:hypothetical protein
VHTPAGFSRTESPPPWALPCTYFVPELAMSNSFEALITHYEKGIHSSALALVEKNINSKLEKSHIYVLPCLNSYVHGISITCY